MPAVLVVVIFVVGGLVASLLAVLVIRGRFGTPKRRGRYALHELLESDEVPRHATRRAIANSVGHDHDSAQIRGNGVLWLDDDTLGFVLNAPRRHLRIRRSAIQSVTAESEFHRVGLDHVTDGVELLVVQWDERGVVARIAFHLEDDPEEWVREVAAHA